MVIRSARINGFGIAGLVAGLAVAAGAAYPAAGLSRSARTPAHAGVAAWAGALAGVRVLASAGSGAAPGAAVRRPTADGLSGVSCAGPASCIAVGARSGGTLAQRWNGSTWAVLPTPSPGKAGNTLAGVSCGSATNCVAVGSYRATPTGPALPLAERWTGGRWRLIAPAATGGYLFGVSCLGPDWCMAVGFGSDGQNTSERWDGTRWRLLSVPNIGGPNSVLLSVSCTARTNCVAVGSGAPDNESTLPYSVRWDGTSWQQLDTPDQDQEISPGLSGVSCISATQCLAVGSGGGTNGTSSLALEWTGTSWQQLSTPAPAAGVVSDALSSVSCTGTSWCMAVGFSHTGSTTAAPLAQTWTGGTWQTVATADLPGNLYPTALAGVSCTSATACLAAGEYTVGDGSFLGDAQLTLDELWNGTTWQIPRPSGYLIQLPGGGTASFHVSWYGSQRGTLPRGVTAAGIAADPVTGGYWVLDSDGGVANFNAPWWGSRRGHLPAGVTARRIAADPRALGYWVLDSGGGVANFNAPWYGSQRGRLSAPVAGLAADPATGGYWILDADGRVANFHAPWFGSQRGRLPAGVQAVGIAADPATGGYWILDSNGGIANFNAPWYGSLAHTALTKPPSALAST